MSQCLRLYVIFVYLRTLFCIIGAEFIFQRLLHNMASNKKRSNAAGSSEGGREADVEVKNLLIDLVKQHPAIYDKSHLDHFRVNLRNEIWDEIGKILDVPGKPFKLLLGGGVCI